MRSSLAYAEHSERVEPVGAGRWRHRPGPDHRSGRASRRGARLARRHPRPDHRPGRGFLTCRWTRSAAASAACPNALPLPSICRRFDLGTICRSCFPPAFAIALLAGIESLLSAVVADGMIGAPPPLQHGAGGAGRRQPGVAALRRHPGHGRHRAHGDQRQERRPHAVRRHRARPHPAADHDGLRELGRPDPACPRSPASCSWSPTT